MPRKEPTIDEDTVVEMKEVFALFDSELDGTIQTEDLGTALRGLGFNLGEDQISDFINDKV
jgi:Ca2+-binding EF-hand superfamily protein